jgi:pullulanase/glycogen debranching enzyme
MMLPLPPFAQIATGLDGLHVLAQGTPMLCAGDEMGHSGSTGNNNPYCQRQHHHLD